MMRILLPPHVHLCMNDSGAVFLDLRRDRYFGVGASDTAVLQSALLDPGTDTTADLIEELKRNGLLTTDSRRGHPWSPLGFQWPQQTLMQEWTEERPRVRIADVRKFMAAYLTAKIWLRLGTRLATQHVRDRNERPGTTQAELSMDRGRHLYAVFQYLRPLVFRATDHCFLDSIVLIEFLARYGVCANWVFGVKLSPFEAHCWVQCGAFIFNGRPESVGAYTRILVV